MKLLGYIALSLLTGSLYFLAGVLFTRYWLAV